MIVGGLDKLYSLDVRGEYSFSGGFGLIKFANARYGHYNPLAGIYQRKKTLKGPKTSLMSIYRPHNPQTAPQQAWRAIFAAGVSGYHALTAPQKLLLSKEARKYRQSGLTLFLRRYLQSHR